MSRPTAQLLQKGAVPGNLGRELDVPGNELDERLQQHLHSLPGHEVAEKDHFSRLPGIVRRHRNACEPRAHRYDVGGSHFVGSQMMACGARLECRPGHLETRIDVSAGVGVEGVVRTGEQPAAETVGHEVDCPVDDLSGAAKPALHEAATRGEVVEAEPAVRALRPERNERIERVRVGRPRREAKGSSAPFTVRRENRDVVPRVVLGLERVVDGRHARSPVLEEKVAHGGRRRRIHRPVGRDRERALRDRGSHRC